ncbi:MAG TPA: AraC family transcriptional regulator [Solirubrobacteraceae bacterium]|nr:AraC family transcriptional regulator [Solirubrobacteraceae bacterium]
MASPPRERDLPVDRLPSDAASPIEVLLLEDATFGIDAQGAREPHRHDYHELFWTRAGEGHHLIDGRPWPVRPGTVTLIGRGQVHVLERARGLSGAVVRFADEILYEGAPARAAPGWLLAGRGPRTIAVPESEADRLGATIGSLAAEARRPADGCSAEIERHLLSSVLLWIERWYDAARTQQRDADDAEVQLQRRFTQLLERDFARHHDAAHYADTLAVPPAALSRALSHATGRATKELITDRVMLEAARLLRFTDLTVGEVAFRAGFGDQLYFSRAFKRHFGEAPMAYRARSRARD